MLLHSRLTFDMILRAETPLAHAKGTIGNISALATEPVRLPAHLGGGFAEIPMISGNAMRHGLREAAAWLYLDAAGQLDATHREETIRLLFNGGVLRAGGQSAIKLDEYRRLCDLFPPIALLGGCSSRIIPGKTRVDPARLICEETLHLLPGYAEDGNHTHIAEVAKVMLADASGHVGNAADYRHTQQNVRMDTMSSPAHRALLSDGARAQIEAKMEARESATNDVEVRETKGVMMPYTRETITTGSLLWWRVEGTVQSELERDTLMAMIAAWLLNSPHVGGGSGQGMGRVRAVHGPVVLDTSKTARLDEFTAQMSSGALLAPETEAHRKVGHVFYAHVAARREAIGAFLAQAEG